ncbi:hypothetical protein QBC46DRAFT_271883 [Diplogelasinospora grovesii]|uniref:Only prolin and serin are matching in the corresponding protein n=1 Tax=Diplogelasinospora grovesii TaxID=303347 RepID=A0AAN6MYE8_9PEZI|nr:hypothetical protein QBC46DRAFT_271883 [Diplogelasinospora grovesii]
MSPRLKPLILPQLVEERRKMELQQLDDGEHSYVYYTHNSSSSDIASPSPVTPTFSRSGHSRYSGSTSSLEMMTPSCSESPASPTQHAHANKNKSSQLPDVQEDPLEREEENTNVVQEPCERVFRPYDFLGDEPCHHESDLAQSATLLPYIACDIDYDLGFLSDTDFSGSTRYKKRRHVSDTGFSSWGTRLGSRLPSLPRWRSNSRRKDFAFSPASDPSLDQRLAFSRAASSRSSSISAPAHGHPDRANEPPLPATPALSFYDSTESFALPSPLDITKPDVRQSLERERTMATTPLLPPLLTEPPPSSQLQTHSLQASPLQSPTVEPPVPEAATSQPYPTPPLSTKVSISSFRRGTVSSTHTEIPSPIPHLLENHDAWSDRLGHANFTIEPKPYSPDTPDFLTLMAFRGDWNRARINYTKHLVRTGEHYGTTSKTYALTEAKWAEIEREWRAAEDYLVRRMELAGRNDAFATMQFRRATEDVLPAAIPRMLSDEGKFPERGDMDIVGPMVRDTVMARDGHDEKKNTHAGWFKNLAEKVGLRR